MASRDCISLLKKYNFDWDLFSLKLNICKVMITFLIFSGQMLKKTITAGRNGEIGENVPDALH
jgi:hypothetical protein